MVAAKASIFLIIIMRRSKRLKLSIEMTRRAGLYIQRPFGLTRATNNGQKKAGKATKLYAKIKAARTKTP